MPKNLTFLFIICLLGISESFAQSIKQLNAYLINESIKIDGLFEEQSWNDANIATDFIQFEPYNGKEATHKSEVKILYDNSAIYIGAKLFDNFPDSIYKELGKRDDGDVNADIFMVALCPFNDGMNAYAFMITAAGVQIDVKFSLDDEDFDWNAVWSSDYKITDYGWNVELRIPYSALRFPNVNVQTWGLNFSRQVRRYREWSTWEFIDKKKKGMNNQSGELIGLKNIKPPIRLSATPYISSYLISEPDKELGYSYNGGMDIKYGINESFTLDMTLIPDFGQIQSDDEVLNLSPFETFYGEKRPFFTEGTELFNKGEIFYSRRVGGTPYNYESVYDSLNKGEDIIKNPSETKMINATKISGRTNQGLGLGFFNGITTRTLAEIKDSLGNIRTIITQPFTNYNMIIFDQSLKNNSFVSLLSTNVNNKNIWANVSGLEFEFNNKSNDYAINGNVFISKKNDKLLNSPLGKRYSLKLGKVSGNFMFSYSVDLIDNLYNQNDMGYLRNNNEINHNLSLKYNIYQPFWKMNTWNNSFDIKYASLYTENEFIHTIISFQTRAVLKNYLFLMYNINYSPFGSNDYYEPRRNGRYYKIPKHIYMNFWFSPDYRKKFLIDLNGGFSPILTEPDRYSIWLGASPRIRINDKMLLVFGTNINKGINDKGFVNSNYNDSIYFGNRNVLTITNTISTGYIFNNKSSVNFRLRHYWSKAVYDKYYLLMHDGNLFSINYNDNHDISFNAFTIDMSYTWNFAPGSEMSIVWKNSLYNTDKIIIENKYIDNLNNALNSPQTNSISLKILYYLDYQYLKK